MKRTKWMGDREKETDRNRVSELRAQKVYANCKSIE